MSVTNRKQTRKGPAYERKIENGSGGGCNSPHQNQDVSGAKEPHSLAVVVQPYPDAPRPEQPVEGLHEHEATVATLESCEQKIPHPLVCLDEHIFNFFGQPASEWTSTATQPVLLFDEAKLCREVLLLHTASVKQKLCERDVEEHRRVAHLSLKCHNSPICH